MPDKVLADLRRRLEPLARAKPPLSVRQLRSTRFGSPLVLSRVHWVEPKLVAESHLSDLDSRQSLAAHGLRRAAGRSQRIRCGESARMTLSRGYRGSERHEIGGAFVHGVIFPQQGWRQFAADFFFNFHRQNDGVDGLQAIFRQRRVRVHDALYLSAAEIRSISDALVAFRFSTMSRSTFHQQQTASLRDGKHTERGQGPREVRRGASSDMHLTCQSCDGVGSRSLKRRNFGAPDASRAHLGADWAISLLSDHLWRDLSRT
jgi:hypothetical protein